MPIIDHLSDLANDALDERWHELADTQSDARVAECVAFHDGQASVLALIGNTTLAEAKKRLDLARYRKGLRTR